MEGGTLSWTGPGPGARGRPQGCLWPRRPLDAHARAERWGKAQRTRAGRSAAECEREQSGWDAGEGPGWSSVAYGFSIRTRGQCSPTVNIQGLDLRMGEPAREALLEPLPGQGVSTGLKVRARRRLGPLSWNKRASTTPCSCVRGPAPAGASPPPPGCCPSVRLQKSQALRGGYGANASDASWRTMLCSPVSSSLVARACMAGSLRESAAAATHARALRNLQQRGDRLLRRQGKEREEDAGAGG